MDVGDNTVTAAKEADASATNEWYTVFLRPGGRLTTPLSSDPKDLQIVVSDGTSPNYAEIASPLTDIQFGRAIADGDTTGSCIWEPISTPNNTDVPQIDVEQIANNRMTATLLKKGNQGWSTDLVIEGTAWNTIRWHEDGEATDQAGTISFSDNSTESITADTGETLGAAGTWYLYKRIGDSANATLVLTQTYSDVYQDDRVLLAIIVRAASDDDSSSPTILPFNGSVPTMLSLIHI